MRLKQNLNQTKKKNAVIRNKYFIPGISALTTEQSRVLKHGDMFAIFNQDGNIRPFGFENHGIYFDGTRFVSRLIFHLQHDKYPLLLSSTIKEENELMLVDFTNPDIETEDKILIPKEQIHFLRTCFLKDQCYHERICVKNYGLSPVKFKFGFEFESDFNDVFEVRGLHRKKRGTELEPVITENTIELRYKGLDNITRITTLAFEPKPVSLNSQAVEFCVDLKKNEHKDFYISICCQTDQRQADENTFDIALTELQNYYRCIREDHCHIDTSNSQFNNWLNRSSSDLFMMLTDTGDGLYPYAGIPWFSTVFGRDGIITALETLWIYPNISKGVLKYLAKHQSTQTIYTSDADPGKILHETRTGEMANLKEIPFAKYYGSIDSTPLFLILAGYYYQRTGDIQLIKSIWQSLVLALDWINKYGDRDKDGFIEYERKTIEGLSQQGWKDSADSVFHSDAMLAEPPIALCEVQGYVYEAKIQMAQLAQAMEDYGMAKTLTTEANELKGKFQQAFWCKDINMTAIALDGKKKPCTVMSSNSGQCLFTGIVSSAMAMRIRDNLMNEHFWSGWGIRTLADTEARYNPMSYHNGSVWPHDNALIAYGLSRYGFKESVLKIMSGLFDASFFMDIHRLPELFCGFPRRQGEGPTLYPVACNPQAWASASVFLLLQACLGISINAAENRIYLKNSLLPAYLEEVRIRNLAVGDSKVDLNLGYHPHGVIIKIMHRTGSVEVVGIK